MEAAPADRSTRPPPSLKCAADEIGSSTTFFRACAVPLRVQISLLSKSLNFMRPVLLAEDDPNDVFFFRRAFEQAGVSNPLEVVRDGAEAIEYLSGQGIYADRGRYPLPCLLLTDIKMPKVDGFELLAWLQRQDHLKHLPAIAISSSCLDADLEGALSLGARAYKRKPADYRQLVEVAKEIKETWLTPQRQ